MGVSAFGRTAVVILLCHMGLIEVLLLVELYQPEEYFRIYLPPLLFSSWGVNLATFTKTTKFHLHLAGFTARGSWDLPLFVAFFCKDFDPIPGRKSLRKSGVFSFSICKC